jgi:hypothetical protein
VEIEIWHGDRLVGWSTLGRGDDGMAVAIGDFRPAPTYVFGLDRFDPDSGRTEGPDLIARTAMGETLEMAKLAIHDYSAEAGVEHGREVEALGVLLYAELFPE